MGLNICHSFADLPNRAEKDSDLSTVDIKLDVDLRVTNFWVQL